MRSSPLSNRVQKSIKIEARPIWITESFLAYQNIWQHFFVLWPLSFSSTYYFNLSDRSKSSQNFLTSMKNKNKKKIKRKSNQRYKNAVKYFNVDIHERANRIICCICKIEIIFIRTSKTILDKCVFFILLPIPTIIYLSAVKSWLGKNQSRTSPYGKRFRWKVENVGFHYRIERIAMHTECMEILSRLESRKCDRMAQLEFILNYYKWPDNGRLVHLFN